MQRPAKRIERSLRRWLAAERRGEESRAASALTGLLTLLPSVEPPAGFADRVMARWRRAADPVRLERWAAGLLVAMTAALVLAADWIPAVVAVLDGSALPAAVAAATSVIDEVASVVGQGVAGVAEIGRISTLVWASRPGILFLSTLVVIAFGAWRLLYQLLHHGRPIHAQTR